MVRSAALLIGCRGVASASFAEVLEASGAPRGSIYHHFPDGKRQLVAEAIEWTCGLIVEHIESGPVEPAEAVLAHFVALWRASLTASGAEAGCPVAAVAIDAADDEHLRELTRRAFEDWVERLAARLQRSGLDAGRAHALALTILAAVEGAVILCRAQRSVGPLDGVEAELKRLVY